MLNQALTQYNHAHLYTVFNCNMRVQLLYMCVYIKVSKFDREEREREREREGGGEGRRERERDSDHN